MDHQTKAALEHLGKAIRDAGDVVAKVSKWTDGDARDDHVLGALHTVKSASAATRIIIETDRSRP